MHALDPTQFLAWPPVIVVLIVLIRGRRRIELHFCLE